MTTKLEILMKITPALSVIFILIGVITAIFAAFNHNVTAMTASLVLISQAVLSIIYVKTFSGIWRR